MTVKPEVIIRNAQLKDIEFMARIGEQTRELWNSKEGGWYSKSELKKWLLSKGDDLLLVAKAGKKLVGFIVVYNLRTWAFCTGLFVDPQFRKRGIAKSLLSAVEKRLKKQGISSLHLLVEQENFPAIRFYEKSKFRKGFTFVWMEKRL